MSLIGVSFIRGFPILDKNEVISTLGSMYCCVRVYHCCSNLNKQTHEVLEFKNTLNGKCYYQKLGACIYV